MRTAAHSCDTGRQGPSDENPQDSSLILMWVSSSTIELQLLTRAHNFIAEAVQLKLLAMHWPGFLEVVFAIASNDYIIDLEYHTA